MVSERMDARTMCDGTRYGRILLIDTMTLPTITITILPQSRSRTIQHSQHDKPNERMDMNLLWLDMERQPKQITDIKKFLEIARRKDAKCEPTSQVGQVGRGRQSKQGDLRITS